MKWVCEALGTGFFVGYIPFAPATCASVVGAAIYWYLVPDASQVLLLVVLGVFVVGLWLSDRLEKKWGPDDRRIVIDEICGVLVAFLFVPRSLGVLIAGLLLFRLFDIWKPFPIRRSERLRGGLGIMLDDLLSGAYANVALRVGLFLFNTAKTF